LQKSFPPGPPFRKLPFVAAALGGNERFVCPLTNPESALGSDEVCPGISRFGAEVVEPRISAMLTLEPLLAQPRTLRNTI